MWSRLKPCICASLVIIFIVNCYRKPDNKNCVISSSQTTNFSQFEGPNPHPFDFILNPSNFCQKYPSPFIIILVHSRPSNLLRRMLIRETWGNNGLFYPSLKLATLFALGAVRNETLQNEVENEFAKFKDIVQEDFIDSYENLTYKSIMLLKWVTNYCPKAEYVLKTDDDVFVNPFSLQSYMGRFHLSGVATHKSIIGAVWEDSEVNTDPNDKWHANLEMETKFNGKFYPKYCSGAGYLITKDLVRSLYDLSFDTGFFRLEDVYITGLVPLKLAPKYVDIKYLYVLAPQIQDQYQRLFLPDNSIFGHIQSDKERKEIFYRIAEKFGLKPAE